LATKKKILITSGPTWIALDRVRVISNLASGETGFILAEKFRKLGFKVTLLLGPGNFPGSVKNIEIIRFNYFHELAQLLNRELKNGGFAAGIHAAAVADYRPEKTIPGKTGSQRRSWKIKLVPTKKLIRGLKRYHPDIFGVGFKFEPDAGREKLLKKGEQLLENARLDLIVANSCKDKRYRAYILGENIRRGPFLNKKKMSYALCDLIKDGIKKNKVRK
jgi:phosphopantothenoylcysteine decarboxylase/phosphopantothenate--cysteine ligase